MTDQPPLFDDLPEPRGENDGTTVEREFVLLAQTSLAIGVSRDGSRDKSAANVAWLPKLHIEWDVYGTSVLVTLPLWLATKEGLTE